MSNAVDLSNTLSTAAEQAGPGIVRIEARVRGTSSGIVWSADGLVVTADHAGDRNEGIVVGLADGKEVSATLVGNDPSTDLAVLKLDASGLSPPAWSEPSALKVGQLALAVARPGRSIRAALGVISALGPQNETFRTPRGGKLNRYVETDIGRHPGFSGGAVLGADGRVLGLHTTGLLRGTALALDAGTVKRIVEMLVAHGGVRRAYLGVGTYPVRLPEGLETQLKQASALLVVSVAQDSPAQKSGLLMGDLLISLAGQPLRHMGDLMGVLDEDHINQQAALKVIRAGEAKDLTITIGTRA